MDRHESLRRFRRRVTGVSFIAFSAVWVFAFAVHPNLLHPRLQLSPEDLIRRAHGDGLLQFAHALVTVNTALLVVLTIHFLKLLNHTPAAWMGTVGAGFAVVGTVLLAADKGALCLTMSALDTLPEQQFQQMTPGLVAVFSFKGLMVLVWGMALMPLGVMLQAVGLWRTRTWPAWRAALLVVSLLFIAFPDGAEIINLVAALLMAAVMVPYGVGLIRTNDEAAAPGPGARTPEAVGRSA
jgi:hypothetical protein